MTAFPLNDLDHMLLALLRTDARMSVADLAKKLEVSRATVGNRIKRLEEGGVIVGYTVRLRPDAEPQEIRAWMSIAVEGDRTPEVVRTLLGEPAVTSLHDTNGRWDLLAEVHAASITELSEVLERVRKIKGIGTTETSIHLQTFCRG
jgi:DNA-binding Lrp family transcriptional regulator